jgi:pyruvate/2-oxoglutarate dehydrogenase complex dihydrolipoamide acyltransferase (E2) component
MANRTHGASRIIASMQRLELSETRRLLLWFFDKPSNDPYVSLTFDVVIEPALRFRDAFTRQHGERIGLQHLVTKAVARTIGSMSALNVKIIGRSIYQLDRVDIAVPVHLEARAESRDETGMMILLDANKKSLLQIARETRHGAAAERRGETSLSGSAVSRRLIKSLPDALVYRGLDVVGRLVSTPWINTLADDRLAVSSGVTNVGSVVALPKGARFRAASATLSTKVTHVASVFGIGPIEEAAVVEDDQVVARKVLPIVMIVDHRAIDGVLMGLTASRVASALSSPEGLA